MSSNKTTFEYKKKAKEETPFETFLKYTDEKEKSSAVLSSLINKYAKGEKIDFLDIGTGNGEYLRMTLEKASVTAGIDFVLLEPSVDLVTLLQKEIKKFPGNNKFNIVNKTWEDYSTDKKFDIILASHLYHIPREKYYFELKRMISLLKENGVLIFVMGVVDDPYKFKMKFKPYLFGPEFKAKILDEFIDVFERISKEDYTLDLEKYESSSTLNIPYKDNMKDTISIIEFYLNKYWEEIPEKIQVQALDFIKQKNGIFSQTDGLLVVRKI